MRLKPYFTLYTKNNSKWIKYLSVRLKTIELSKENISEKLYDIGLNDFLDTTLKPQALKAKIDTHDCLKV